ncbi:hypothetical protein [Streptomyces sp. YKOK-I1]
MAAWASRSTPALSLASTAKTGTKLTVPIGFQGPAAKQGAVKSLTVAVSYDGGRTWKPAKVATAADGKRSVTLTHPAAPAAVGLKTTLVDQAGNTVTESLPDAYRTVRRRRPCRPTGPGNPDVDVCRSPPLRCRDTGLGASCFTGVARWPVR